MIAPNPTLRGSRGNYLMARSCLPVRRNVKKKASPGRSAKNLLRCPLIALIVFISSPVSADEFDQFIKPLFAKSCNECHVGEHAKGEVNLAAITTADQFRSEPELIEQLIEAIDGQYMPPEEQTPLDSQTRSRLLSSLKTILKDSTVGMVAKNPPRRLNRFQYNNAIRDLFQINRDIFPLPERLMVRHVNYLQTREKVLPDEVQVSSQSVSPHGGFENVQPYPKDLRAAHGFDNQANQLTLSPLLLDAYLRLSLSIVESPDFSPQNVGLWQDLFAVPVREDDIKAEIRHRLAPLMQRAFRVPVEEKTLDRYTEYTWKKMQLGLSFTDAMKKGASAVLCSPLFLYRYDATPKDHQAFELASRLSFFLWGSGPDDELLKLAASGELLQDEVLNLTIQRMITDAKIERFLDSFPTQWMQLENLFGVVPDPRIYPQYRLDGGVPASVQMVLEPLLLFDAIFVENRPVIELIKPKFAYRSEFLQRWYGGELSPSNEYREQVAEELRVREQARSTFTNRIAEMEAERGALMSSVRDRLLTAKKGAQADGSAKTIDLQPYAAWDFNGDLTASLGSLDLMAHGDVDFNDGHVVLADSYLESPKLPIDLSAKTLEVWCRLSELKQAGGGVMTIQGEGHFDSIVYGERKRKHWISGSEGHRRTQDFTDSTPETEQDQPLHLVMVYDVEGNTTLYRNGRPYGESYNKGAVKFSKGVSSVLFGLRHLPAGGNKYLTVSIDKARLYDHALSGEQVAAAAGSEFIWVTDNEVIEAMTDPQRAKLAVMNEGLAEAKKSLAKLPKRNPKEPINANEEAQRRFNRLLIAQAKSRVFQRVSVEDPRYGGIITTAATLTMTSAPKRTLPIARGAWMIEVIFNDPPPPPPNDVPPLNEGAGSENLTIREKFAKHRENPDCAGCHARIDPLGFALENFDITGRWRDKYENSRDVDASGTLLKKHDFTNIIDFKESLVKEDKRFAKAFVAHLLRFAVARELSPADAVAVDEVIANTQDEGFKLKSLIRAVILSESFQQFTTSVGANE